MGAHELRVALTVASGFELCRAVVREALLGRSFAVPLSLRARLASARKARLERSGFALKAIKDTPLAPGSAPAFDPAKPASEHPLVLGWRAHEGIGTSASRRAVLPAAAFEDVRDSAELGHDPVIETYRQGERPGRVVYAPELILRSSPEGQVGRSLAPGTDEPADKGHDVPLYGRSYFEALFASRGDPWRYANAYEQRKYEQTLSLIPNEGSRSGDRVGLCRRPFHRAAGDSGSEPRSIRHLASCARSCRSSAKGFRECSSCAPGLYERADSRPLRSDRMQRSALLSGWARNSCKRWPASWRMPSSRAAILSQPTLIRLSMSPTNRVSTGGTRSGLK